MNEKEVKIVIAGLLHDIEKSFTEKAGTAESTVLAVMII